MISAFQDFKGWERRGLPIFLSSYLAMVGMGAQT